MPDIGDSGIAKRFLIYFSIFTGCIISVIGVAFYIEDRNHLNIVKQKELDNLTLQKDILERQLRSIKSDIMIEVAHLTLKSYLEQGNSVALDEFAEELFQFSKIKKIYDQVRYIDEKGKERVRINYNEGNQYIVSKEELLDKSHRYYFKDASRLNVGDTYVSSLDFNNDQDSTENDLQPTIRFATPVFDRNGKRRGIFIVNYLGSDLIKAMRGASAGNGTGIPVLLTQDGYWIIGLSGNQMGFNLNDEKGRRFQDHFLTPWQRMSGKETGQFFCDEGLFTFSRIYPLAAGRDFDGDRKFYWTAVSYLSSDLIMKEKRRLLVNLFFLSIPIIIITAPFSMLMADLSKRRKTAEERLRFLEKALETTHMGITITDVNGRIVYSNPADAQIHGYDVEELLGQDVRIYSPPELMNPQTVEQIRSSKGRKKESVNVRKDGSRFPVYLINDIVRNDKGEPLGMVTTSEDITDRKKTEEDLKKSREVLRSLAMRVQKIREEERKRMARNIHDDLGQVLTVFKFDLFWISKRLNDDQEALKEKIGKTSQLIDSAIEKVQKFSSELRPTVLDDLGIVAGIEWQAEEFQERTGINCSVAFEHPQFDIDNELATEIFRIFQEALTNIARHAKADSVRCCMKNSDGSLVLKVADNGRGITEQEIADPNSIGLIGMKERVYPWGGDIEIFGTPGKGTLLTVTVPLNKRSENDKGAYSRRSSNCS